MCSHANLKHIPPPLGKAEEKAETTKLVQTDVQFRSVQWCLLAFLFVCFAFSSMYVRATRIDLCHGASVSFRVVMGGIMNSCVCMSAVSSQASTLHCVALAPDLCHWPRPRVWQRSSGLEIGQDLKLAFSVERQMRKRKQAYTEEK